MRKFFTLLFVLSTVTGAIAQQTVFVGEDTTKVKDLEQAIVTGQYKPQSAKSSVYQVRVINNERIRNSGATNVQQVLATQLGFRFSNDNTLGTTDVQLMGMSGRNVKILLDGIPLADRGDTRESLLQVDLNTIERIEIVDGPMAVSYGSDALAGVINLITKRSVFENISVYAKAQEETAGKEYYPFSYKGTHMQSAGLDWNKKGLTVAVGGSHNEQDGFGGDNYGRGKSWRPKEQWLGNARVGFSNNFLNIYYRVDGLNETITNREPINFSNFKAIDKKYISDRFMHQVQGQFHFNNKANLSSIISYTDYKRQTITTRHNFETGTDELTTGAGEQDVSKLKSFVFRNTFSYQFSPKLSIQPGIDINHEEASGERILGSPVINDYAFFASAEIKPNSNINIRPGVRVIKNSVYDAPPVIPAINTKFVLSKQLDLRLAYAYGFRSPALRELYFYFHDANHDINGNPNLKAEHSNSFTGSLNWVPLKQGKLRYSSSLGAFFNIFKDQIDLALGAGSVYTYFNINKSKTVGGVFDNRFSFKKLDASVGVSVIGFASNQYETETVIKEDDRNYLWTPEVNASLTYRIPACGTVLSIFYKYTGAKSDFKLGTNASGQEVIYVAKTSAFHMADFTASTRLYKHLTLNAGIRNIFNVTSVNSTSASTAHSEGGALAMSFGRSYLLGLAFQWSKK